MNGASQPAVLGWEWGIESEEEGLGTAPVAMPHQGCQLHSREATCDGHLWDSEMSAIICI